jgi:hypothetical protein
MLAKSGNNQLTVIKYQGDTSSDATVPSDKTKNRCGKNVDET